jgi:hypothetical protein
MMDETYQCDKHGTDCTMGECCPDCMEALANRRNPDEMTGEERAAEFRWWGDILTVPFSDLHQRIQELVGRPVWTHEMAGKAAVELLIDEARTRTHPTRREIIDTFPRKDLPVIIIEQD